MKIFLSWSGDRSRLLAEKLREWLPNVIQALDPWMSAEDIAKGSPWLNEITSSLNQANGVGIFCVTPENVTSPWLNFEAGYLASCDQARVCVVTLGLESPLRPPLGLFQCTTAEGDDIRKLLLSLNARTARPLPPHVFDKAFEAAWPELEKAFEEISATAISEPAAEKRSAEDMFSELLSSNRRIESLLLDTPRYASAAYQLSRHPRSSETQRDMARLAIAKGLTTNGAQELSALLANYSFSESTSKELENVITDWYRRSNHVYFSSSPNDHPPHPGLNEPGT